MGREIRAGTSARVGRIPGAGAIPSACQRNPIGVPARGYYFPPVWDTIAVMARPEKPQFS
jgi:hypothetical protein